MASSCGRHQVAVIAPAPVDRSRMTTRSIERAGLLLKRDLTLGALFDRLAKVHGDRQLVTEADGGLDLTYQQAAKRVRRWSGGIAAQVQPGDVVVVATPNGYEQLLLCCRGRARGRAAGTRERPDAPGRRSPTSCRDSGATLVLKSAAAVDRHPALAEPVKVQSDDVAALFYTSGTTGTAQGRCAHPPGARRSGGPCRAVARPPAPRRGRHRAPRRAHHGLRRPHRARRGRASRPTCCRKFHPVKVLDAIEARRATMFVGVPAMYRMLEEAHADERDLTSVRVWASGADAMPPELAERFKRMGATATRAAVRSGRPGGLRGGLRHGRGRWRGGGQAVAALPRFEPGTVRRGAGLRPAWLRDARRRTMPAPRRPRGRSASSR